ncbi:hypothetical protein WKW80_34255 [Variovorax humicola]|uniref:Secreted protein n=1 Tax=Variovorax humicola TaxID=1769758 RepID=A0ABU8WAE4_9BURK
MSVASCATLSASRVAWAACSASSALACIARFTASATAVDTLPAVASLFVTADFASSAALFPARSASLAAWFAAFQTFWLAVWAQLAGRHALGGASRHAGAITSRPSISFDLMESL